MPNFNRLHEFVQKNYSHFGINKQRELTRLLFEISKREKNNFDRILPQSQIKNFHKLKNYLLKRRFPESFDKCLKDSFYLPKIEINENLKFVPGNFKFYPQNIYIEKNLQSHEIVQNLKKLFPESRFSEIPVFKKFIKEHSFKMQNYTDRLKNLFVIKENFDFLKPCPCSKSVVCCGYYIFNLGFGCPFECSYCFLQNYQNINGIIITVNLQDFFEKFKEDYFKKYVQIIRIGSGEFTDSLALDYITGYSVQIVNFFKNYKNVYFEFKTKSSNIKNLLKTDPAPNIVVSWSVNPQKIISETEFYTAPLHERISCALSCADAGYSVGFHFDPIIYYASWENDYKNVLNLIFDTIPSDKILWISLGTLRFNPELKKIIEQRFPENKILDSELILDFDKKLRYHKNIRFAIYEKMINYIRKRDKKVWVYLCMENSEMWNALKIRNFKAF